MSLVNVKHLLEILEQRLNQMDSRRIITFHVFSDGYQDFEPFLVIHIGQRSS